jgi:hypothetical protein
MRKPKYVKAAFSDLDQNQNFIECKTKLITNSPGHLIIQLIHLLTKTTEYCIVDLEIFH